MSPASGVMSPTLMPPGHMAMLIGSPPRGGGGGGGGRTNGTAPSLSDVLKRLSLSSDTRPQQQQGSAAAADGEAAAAAAAAGGGQLQIDLGCLLAPEARGLSITTKKRQKPAAATSQPGSTGEGTVARHGGDLSSISGQANASPSSSMAAAAAGGGQVTASPPPAGGKEGGSSVISGGKEGVSVHDAAYYGRIRQELGQGEGVTALLERSKGSGGPVVATEDDGGIGGGGGGGGGGQCFSDDEGPGGGPGGGGHHGGVGSSGPMSPSTRLRRDTFGATLDFIEALCDASSSLASFSQVRISVEHIRVEHGVWKWQGRRHTPFWCYRTRKKIRPDPGADLIWMNWGRGEALCLTGVTPPPLCHPRRRKSPPFRCEQQEEEHWCLKRAPLNTLCRLPPSLTGGASARPAQRAGEHQP